MTNAKPTLQLQPNARVCYCKTKREAEICCKLIKPDCEHYAIWSFDCEWKVSYIPGKNNRVALLQFGRDDIIILFHIASCGLQQCIIDILLNPNIIKVGVNIRGDVLKIHRDLGHLMGGSYVMGVCDLRRLSEVTCLPPAGSLAGMVDTELNLTLPKPEGTRCGNWEIIPLSEEQKNYAALDVYAGYLVLRELLFRWSRTRHVTLPLLPGPGTLSGAAVADGLLNDKLFKMLCKNSIDHVKQTTDAAVGLRDSQQREVAPSKRDWSAMNDAVVWTTCLIPEPIFVYKSQCRRQGPIFVMSPVAEGRMVCEHVTCVATGKVESMAEVEKRYIAPLNSTVKELCANYQIV